MKKIYLFIASLICYSGLQAQFMDDFESYTSGAYLAQTSPNWTTWSGQTGTTEDVKIVTTKSYSGSKSIYFASTSSNGGPADVVLPFGGSYSTGTFEFETMLFVETAKGAYFNFQGEQTIGSMYSLECFFISDGNLYVSSDSKTHVSTSYPSNSWFNLKITADLTLNNWEVFVDGVSVGTFQNNKNKVASIDIFPYHSSGHGATNNNSGFWMDDVQYTYTAYTLSNLNLGLTKIGVDDGLAGQTRTVKADVRNLGTEAINSFDINYDYDGASVSESVTGVNISSLATYTHTFSQNIILAPGNNPLTITISNVNGNIADDNQNDDVKTLNLNPVVPAAGKKLIIEEATGTWCGWCPRGHVFMERMQQKYGDYFIGVAVHSGDPMANPTYESGISNLVNGHPSALVDRKQDIDPSAMEADILERLILAPAATLENLPSFNPSNKTLTLDVDALFNINTTGNWKMACVLTEDSVKGTTSGYAQSNYYAGGSSGAMGGYESKSNPVPAAQMVYNHVGRAITPSFLGQANLFPSSIDAGTTHTNSFNFVINDAWNMNKMHAICMLIDSTGKVSNANSIALAPYNPCSIAIKLDSSKNTINGVGGSIAVSSTGAIGPVSYTWSPNVGTGNYLTNLAPGAYAITVSDSLGCSRTINVTLNNTTVGIDSKSSDGLISINPNPTNGMIDIELSKVENSAFLNIIDMNGRIVFTEKITSVNGLYKSKIDLSSQSNGLYLIQLVNGNAISTKRVVKN